MAEYNYLKFTGSYPNLKRLGYTFQKLYANNYMSWSKNGIFIFKKGADITHGELNLHKLITFLRGKPAVRPYDTGIVFYKFYSDPDTNTYEYYPYTDENRDKYSANLDEWGKYDGESGEEAPEYMATVMVGNNVLAQLEELNKLGWYELATEHYDD